MAHRSCAIVRSELPRVADGLGLGKAGPYPIYAYTSRTEFQIAAGPRPFLEGVSYQPTGLIRIDASGPLDATRHTLAHELTHSALNQKLGSYIDSLPLWVNEGIAGDFSDPVTPGQFPAVVRIAQRDGVLPVDALTPAFTDPHSVDTAYLQSRSMVAWLVYTYPNALPLLTDYLAKGDTFATALYTATGLTPQTWWEQWQRSIPSYAYWLAILSSPVVYAPFAIILAIIAIIRIWQRKKRQEEPEEEDDEASEDEAT